jgi:integrase
LTWIRRAIRASHLSPGEKDIALRASPHWLRHTCGTRALERGVEVADLQGQFGHADPRTTMRYSKKQMQRRQAAFGKAFS